jgi:hypothetical protein
LSYRAAKNSKMRRIVAVSLLLNMELASVHESAGCIIHVYR